jgi:glycosyltransferase involved in cell wall biosynthesis
MRYPKISIITPSLNQGEFIEDTIKSVIEQNYPNLEFFVVDGGSTDETIDIIKRYEDQITFWVSEPDTGQSNAINKGLRMATGDIINWLNSDDVLAPGALRKVAENFKEGGRTTGMVYGGTMFFDHRGDIAPDFGYENPSMERFLSGIAFSQPSAFIRKSYLDEVGYLSDSLHFGMDYDLYARLSLVCDFKLMQGEVLSRYRMHGGSKTVALNDQFVEEWIRIFIRVMKNVNAEWVLSRLKRLGLFDEYTGPDMPYEFKFKRPMVNQKQMLFYFLCYLLKSDYHNSRFDRARIVQRYLINHFGYDKTTTEKDVGVVVKRLRALPSFLIRWARQMKALLQ